MNPVMKDVEMNSKIVKRNFLKDLYKKHKLLKIIIHYIREDHHKMVEIHLLKMDEL